MALDDARITELMDREAIRDCLFRYARGIDRADEAALRSSYWPDATDRHGPWQGTAADFIAVAVQSFRSGPRTIHQISNILIEFRGPDRAAVESHFNALQRSAALQGQLVQVHLAGRYCDLFEKRAGEWRVLDRVVVYDWVAPQPLPEGAEAERFGPRQPIGAAFPHDPVYAIGRDITRQPVPDGAP